MFFRGAPFQRDGRGRCNLPPATALSSKNAHLFPSGLPTPPRELRPRSFFLAVTSTLELQHSLECSVCDPLMAQRFHQSPRHGPMLGRMKAVPIVSASAHHEGLVHVARASDVCQASTGESYSVS
jgi:hypothetical protein